MSQQSLLFESTIVFSLLFRIYIFTFGYLNIYNSSFWIIFCRAQYEIWHFFLLNSFENPPFLVEKWSRGWQQPFPPSHTISITINVQPLLTPYSHSLMLDLLRSQYCWILLEGEKKSKTELLPIFRNPVIYHNLSPPFLLKIQTSVKYIFPKRSTLGFIFSQNVWNAHFQPSLFPRGLIISKLTSPAGFVQSAVILLNSVNIYQKQRCQTKLTRLQYSFVKFWPPARRFCYFLCKLYFSFPDQQLLWIKRMSA